MVGRGGNTSASRSAGKAFYSRPRSGRFTPRHLLRQSLRLREMPIYQMEALALSRGQSRQHMQLSIMTDLEDIPAFRRFGGFTAYSEGWGALYRVSAAGDGLLRRPLLQPLAALGAMELWRAARLVVDTGLHDQRWSARRGDPVPDGEHAQSRRRCSTAPSAHIASCRVRRPASLRSA